MRVRSPGLLALSLALLALGGSLAGLLKHDGQVIGMDALMAADEGDELVLQSTVQGVDRGGWAHLAHLPLANHTYTAAQEEGLWLVATSNEPLPMDAPVVLEGTVVHEDILEDGLKLVLVHVERFEEPLVFR